MLTDISKGNVLGLCIADVSISPNSVVHTTPVLIFDAPCLVNCSIYARGPMGAPADGLLTPVLASQTLDITMNLLSSQQQYFD